jgi:hypothetical protein
MIDFVRPNTRSFEDLGARELIGIRRIAREVGLGVGTVPADRKQTGGLEERAAQLSEAPPPR